MALTPISGEITAQPLNDNFSYLNERKNDLAINVKDYGAIGDGVTDDTIAIQSAINAAITAGGGKIFFPSGKYKITATLICTSSNVSFIGDDVELLYSGVAFSKTLDIHGTIETAMNITVAITAGDNTFTVSPADAATITAGDYIKISTNENYFIITGRDYKKGEIIKVASVNAITGVVTIEGKGIVLSYSITSLTPTAQVINFIENIKIEGIKFTGTSTDDGQIALQMDYVKNITVNQNEISEFESGVALTVCLFADINNNYIHDCNKAGTGYGVNIGGSSQRVNIHRNKFENNRHSFTTSGYDGVVMYIDVSHNHVFGDDNAGLNAHGNARFVRFSHNHVDHCDLGISSYSPYTIVEHNTITHTNLSPIYFIEAAFINAIIRGNTIEYNIGTSEAISVGNSGATAYETNDYIIIENNLINNVQNSTGILVGSGTSAILVSVRNNDLINVGYLGIKVVEGEKIIINGNNLNLSIRSGTSGIDGITATCTTGVGIYGSIMQISNNNVYRFNKAVVVTLADVLLIDGNVCQSVSGVNFAISGVTTVRTGENFPDVYAGTLTWNPTSLVDGAGETSPNITVAGATVTDLVEVYAPYSTQGIIVYGYISAADTINIRIQNETGATIDLASGIWRVSVMKK